MLALFNLICITLILPVILFIYSTAGDECLDTVNWHDEIHNSTCSDYVTRGWCVNKTLTSALKYNSTASLNFPELNCCECGKKTSLKLSPTARWVENATTVAGMANGTNGTSLDMLYGPYGIQIVDDSTLYIGDDFNNRVVLVQLNSTTATTVIGQESQSHFFQFYGPTAIFITQTSIYVLDTFHFRVRKWSRNLSDSDTAAGVLGVKGDSTSMRTFSTSYGLFVDNYGNLFVSDYGNHRVMMFPWNSTSGTIGAMVAGTGVSGPGINQLNGPVGIFVDDNRILYIADSENHRIQKWIIGANSSVTVAGTEGGGNGSSQLYFPYAVLVDSNGYMYIVDGGNNRITRWAPGASAGECIVACSGDWGVAANQLNEPSYIAFDSSGSLYVSDFSNNRVQKFQILSETTQSTTSLINTTSQSTLSTISQNMTQITTTTATQGMILTSTTHSKATLIKAQVYIISTVLLVKIVF